MTKSNRIASYGARRGNDEVMARGTFANIRLVNKVTNSFIGLLILFATVFAKAWSPNNSSWNRHIIT